MQQFIDVELETLYYWSRRGPNRSRFPLPNEIWKLELKPTEFMILSYLYYHDKHGGRVTLSPKSLAEAVHVCEDTLNTHLAALMEKDLVTAERKPVIPCKSGGDFFSLPVEIFLLKLPASALAVYAYLLYREDRRTKQCHPSYRVIAESTHMTVNTVRKQIGLLAELQLIEVKRTQYFDGKGMRWNGNNLYTICSVRPVVNEHYQRQLRQLDALKVQRQIQKRVEKLDSSTFQFTPAKAP